MKQQSNNKKLIGTAISVAVMVLVVNLATPKKESLDEKLSKEIEKINKEYPLQLDEYLRIDSVRMPISKHITYYMTVNMLKEEANYESIEQFVHPNILSSLKTNPSLDLFRKNRITLTYKFNDKNAMPFHEFIVMPDMYADK